MTINGRNGSMALVDSITISSGVGIATSSGHVAGLTSNTGIAGILGDLLLNTGTASIGNSSAFGYWEWLVCVWLGG